MKNQKDNNIRPTKFFDFDYFILDFVKFTAALPGLIYYRPKYIYENDDAKAKIHDGALVIANHVGFFDPIYCMFTFWYRRHHFICLKDFFENPKSRFWFSNFHCIPIDRENFGVDTFKVIVDHLKAGHMVSMFPEGHLEENVEKINTFKSGMILMALKSKKPVVPIFICPKKTQFSRLKVIIGEPVDVVKLYGDKPKFSQIDAACKLLFEKENFLKEMANKY